VLTLLRRLANLHKDRSAVAAIEFALLSPLLVFFMVVEFDVYRYVMTTQRLEAVAESVAEMFASATTSPLATIPGNGVVADSDINFYMNSALFVYPDVLTSPAVQQGSPWYLAMEVDTAAIAMIQYFPGVYTPTTIWHGTNQSTANTRKCNTVYTIVSNSSVATPTSLPTGVVGPNAIIVVDVRTTFQPTFAANYMPAIPIVRSVYMTPRNVPFVEYHGTGSSAVNC
jgi:Flp pilus assembly protein TadG